MKPKVQAFLYASMVLFLSVMAIGRANAGVNATYDQHPYYLHALSDLRAARWMIQHRPGDWAQTVDEVEAVRRIDAAIGEIKKAAIEDGKNLEDHPPVDERPDHFGRLHAALDFLRKARQDISHDEDNRFAQGLQARAYMHIDGAINAVKKAIHQ
ncbi:MAG TPA: hypothetical protein VKQ52_09695 [Puia sp.]|nr:hypothetical protein [Puia sp.]